MSTPPRRPPVPCLDQHKLHRDALGRKACKLSRAKPDWTYIATLLRKESNRRFGLFPEAQPFDDEGHEILAAEMRNAVALDRAALVLEGGNVPGDDESDDDYYYGEVDNEEADNGHVPNDDETEKSEPN